MAEVFAERHVSYQAAALKMLHVQDKKIGCLILNYNAGQFTISCAESVLKGKIKPEWLVIVDNASTDNSLVLIKEWQNKKKENNIVILPQKVNKGYAAGNNSGLRWLLSAGADSVWILNNDTIVDENALGAMIERLYSKRRPGLCGSLILYMDKPETIQCRGGGKTNWITLLSRQNGSGLNIKQALLESPESIEKQLNYIYGASVLASKEFLEKIGLMDEGFFLYCEEQDWALRARKHFDLAYAPKSLVWHKEGATSGCSYRGKNLKSLFRLAKSRLRVTYKHHPWFIPTVIGASILRLGQKTIRALIYCSQLERKKSK